MKSITEFANFTLTKALAAHAALLAEGKNPEEIQASLGQTFKLEGDRLKYFLGALDVAGKNTENLKRVVVVSLGEGETAPQKAIQIEETHYIPEFYQQVGAKPVGRPEPQGRGGRSGGGGGRGGPGGGKGSGGPKSSPWGLSPEEKAAKNAKKAPAKPN
jgi:hypothetical protein